MERVGIPSSISICSSGVMMPKEEWDKDKDLRKQNKSVLRSIRCSIFKSSRIPPRHEPICYGEFWCCRPERRASSVKTCHTPRTGHAEPLSTESKGGRTYLCLQHCRHTHIDWHKNVQPHVTTSTHQWHLNLFQYIYNPVTSGRFQSHTIRGL